MNKQAYKSIRGRKDFLYQYFLMSGGKNVGATRFSTLLVLWLSRKGMGAQQGMLIITHFLDRKFGS